MTDVISLTGVVKSFGRGASAARALDGLDLAVAPGEVHGLLGPNGAGKSTTLRILLSLLRPDAGEVRLFGRDAWRDAVAPMMAEPRTSRKFVNVHPDDDSF